MVFTFTKLGLLPWSHIKVRCSLTDYPTSVMKHTVKYNLTNRIKINTCMISAHLVPKFTKHTEFVMKNRCTLHLEHNFGNTSCKIITSLSKSVYPNVILMLQTCSYNKLHIDWTILTSANSLFIASISIMKMTKKYKNTSACQPLPSTEIYMHSVGGR